MIQKYLFDKKKYMYLDNTPSVIHVDETKSNYM